MHHPALPLSPAALPSWLLVLVCAVSGAYCLRQVRRAGGAAAGEAVMGFGMALMALPLGAGGGWQAPALTAVFCAATVHAVWLLRTGLHHAHHLVGSLTMVYMGLMAGAGPGAGDGPGGHGGHGQGAGLPLLTGLLLLYYAGYVVLGGARLAAAGPAGASGEASGEAGPAAGAAELTGACRLAMGIGMLAMLLQM